MRTLGAILAGGQSRRFGSDKALAEWRGRPLIDHVTAALAPYVEHIIICGRQVPDRPGPGLGPLGGVNAALAYAADHHFDRVLIVPCDTPALDDRLLARLVAENTAAFLSDIPVIGIWPAALGAELDAWLARGGDLSVRSWALSSGATPLAIPSADIPVNVNRPTDLADLERLP